MNHPIKEISGTFTLEPNPCLTKPCLPGVIPAIRTEKIIYFLVVEGHYANDPFTWQGRQLKIGETIRLKGKVSTKTDINKEKFYTLDLESTE